MSNIYRKVAPYGERIAEEQRKLISKRYHIVTKAINEQYWDSQSDILHSLYVGSYGRNTAIDTSDIDILVELPESEYYRFDNLSGNGQSRLLQSVKAALSSPYPRSQINADGQIVKIKFSDEIYFEILPAFKNSFGKYKYPNTNQGGSWQITDPKKEQEAMRVKNTQTNGLLFDTCRHMRLIRDECFSSYFLSGIVIDSFVYHFMDNWHWPSPDDTPSENTASYEEYLFQKFNENKMLSYGDLELSAPGSGDEVSTEKSIDCLEKVLRFMADK